MYCSVDAASFRLQLLLAYGLVKIAKASHVKKQEVARYVF